MTKRRIEVEALRHKDAKRRNIPTAEFESVMREEDKSPVQIAYERRNRDLDPQLVWRGKDEQDWSDLIVQAPPLYIQEKVHPKVLIDDLRRESKERTKEKASSIPDLFADFNGLPDLEAKTEFYQHDANWSNRMILGDSLSVMASLAEREGLRGQVQCIYVDPPYGIRFNSNFQWSTTSTIVKDGNKDHITREPEQVRAFRDTWRDGIHSYLTYLRDRLTVARDLLHESGSIFVQIGDENVHRVRAVLDEVFGEANFVSQIGFRTKIPLNPIYVGNLVDHIIFYAKKKAELKFRRMFVERDVDGSTFNYIGFEDGRVALAKETDTSIGRGRRFTSLDFMASGYTQSCHFGFRFQGKEFNPRGTNSWKTTPVGVQRAIKSDRLVTFGTVPRLKQYFDDYPVMEVPNFWSDTQGASGKTYVVQTATKVIERCILMATDPGDLVLDSTCGSGTTAYVAEQWGRRWITIDTSRVALALARSRIMGARYSYYILADTPEGQMKEAEVTRSAPRTALTRGSIRQGFVYERVPHTTLGAIAGNAEIDVIWDEWQQRLEPLRTSLNIALSQTWEEWQVPREADAKWPAAAKVAHAKWWEGRIARQKEIDASIAAKAEYEYLYDKPYVDNSRVRVAGPFTVESLSPHRVLTVGAGDELIDGMAEPKRRYRHDGSGTHDDFADMILENLKAAGVQQAHKDDRITFTALLGWPGRFICAEGRFMEGAKEKRAGILIGPEFGTVSRPDLVAAAREAGDAGFDVLIACAFNYDAHSAEFDKLGRVPVLRARMNPELHMGDELKATPSGNLFVIFGEPDIAVVSGRWLVARSGRMVAAHERFAQFSGLGSLEEINRLGGVDLPRLKRLALGREIRSDLAGAARGGVGPGEHRGGSRTGRNGGVPPLPRRGEGLPGGDRNAADPGTPAGLSAARVESRTPGSGLGDRTDALRSDEIAAIEALTPADLPLALTTNHWTQVTIRGIDVFKPQTGEIESGGPDTIALWMIDTDYNEESFFVRHAYFLGANDPYKALKTTLKAEIDEEAWASLNSDTSRPFPKPTSGRVAVKVINHLGDEVMKVFSV